MCREWSWFFSPASRIGCRVDPRTKNIKNIVNLHQKFVPSSEPLRFARYDEICVWLNFAPVPFDRRPAQWDIGITNLKVPFERALFSLSFEVWCSYAAEKTSLWKKSRFLKLLRMKISAEEIITSCACPARINVEREHPATKRNLEVIFFDTVGLNYWVLERNWGRKTLQLKNLLVI